MKEQVLWGVKDGDEDWQEVVLCTQPERFEHVRQLAKNDGYGRFRVSVMDMSKPPDFAGTIQSRKRK